MTNIMENLNSNSGTQS